MRSVEGAMIREQDALLMDCPILNIKDVDFDDGSCEGSICPQWTRQKTALTEPPRGDCYWLERRRRREEMERKREEG